MELDEIISISGQGGLFKVVANTKNGLIVESFSDGKRIPVFSAYKVSTLSDISIYTADDDIALGDVFEKMVKKEGGKEAIDHKSNPEDLKSYFKEVLPEYDEDRVYVSDIKKVLQWYNQLQTAGFFKDSGKKKESKKENKEEAVDEVNQSTAEKDDSITETVEASSEQEASNSDKTAEQEEDSGSDEENLAN